jgi:hypothetical protein
VKIEWLNDDLRAARLTRGVLWWKQVACVKRISNDDYRSRRWAHCASGNICDESQHVEDTRTLEIARRRSVNDWQPVRQLPHARLLGGDR